MRRASERDKKGHPRPLCSRGFPNHDMTFSHKISPCRRLRESCFASISRTTYLLFLPANLVVCLLLHFHLSHSSVQRAFSAFRLLHQSIFLGGLFQHLLLQPSMRRRGVAAWHIFPSPFLFISLKHACFCSVFSIGRLTFLVPGTSRSHTFGLHD